MSTRPTSQSPVLVISHEVVGSSMAGPGIRYYHLARVLSQEFKVILAVPPGSDLIPTANFQVLVYHSGQDPILFEVINHARAILAPAAAVGMLPALVHTPVPLILDGYDPFLAETLFLQKAETNEQLAALSLAYFAGDFFICASERQRDWWLGLLEASGRINIYTYNEDASLRRLVDLVPFGLPATPPQHTRFVVKGVWPNISQTDRVILWGGGLWPWLDPLTAIRAFAKIWQHRQDIRLIFPGTRHPNPAMAGIPTHTEAARELARSYQLLDRGIFFGDWVAYQDWPNVLLESDLALTLHGSETLEARLAFRSRVLDYFWAKLPVVATAGDVTSDLIAHYQVGQVVDGRDEEAAAQAILQLLDTPRESFDPRFEKLCASLTWECVARPLIEFCRQPRRAPDKVALGEKLGLPLYYQIQALQQRLAEREVQIANSEAHIAKLEQHLINRAVRWLSLRLPPRLS